MAQEAAWEAGKRGDGTFEAAQEGNLPRLIYLHHTDCYWDESVCSMAARGGHIDCLRYLHVNGCPWDADACRAAAGGGHLECLRYLHVNGCPWKKYTLQEAVRKRHLECVRYLHDNGCPWDRHTFEFAVRAEFLQGVRYLNDNGCPWEPRCARNAADHMVFWCAVYGLALYRKEMIKATTLQRALTSAALCLGTTSTPRLLIRNIVELALLPSCDDQGNSMMPR